MRTIIDTASQSTQDRLRHQVADIEHAIWSALQEPSVLERRRLILDLGSDWKALAAKDAISAWRQPPDVATIGTLLILSW